MENDMLTAYAAIFTMSVVPIYIGSHLSLSKRGTKTVKKTSDGKEVTITTGSQMETMSSEDAWKFPFVGSAVLGGLYVLFKVFGKEYINMLLSAYFLFFGVIAITQTIKPFFTPLFSSPLVPWKFSIKIPFFLKEPQEVSFDKADIIAFFVSCGIGAWYITTKHWIANNIFGLSFSIQGIALLALGSYKIGCILLGGLFFYDIFWVFGTDVMVTVATSFEAPIKLQFPKNLFAAELQYSMIGLGDIVIPGIFIALLLRFDAKQSGDKPNFAKPYFWTCYIGYFIGLATTIGVMHFFQAAQPALLYLVPACIISSFGLATLRGEVSALLAYNEEADTKDTNKNPSNDKKKD